MKVRLTIPHGPNRYGPGKIHVLSKASGYTETWCGRSVYAAERTGDDSEATCLRCNPNAERQPLAAGRSEAAGTALNDDQARASAHQSTS
jgi:hypothetical protein